MYQEDNEEDAFYTRPAINLLGTVLFQIKFYLRNDTTEVVNAIVPEFFVNEFKDEFIYMVEDIHNGIVPELGIHNALNYLPELDFDVNLIESGEILWALNIPVTGFPGWLDGYELS